MRKFEHFNPEQAMFVELSIPTSRGKSRTIRVEGPVVRIGRNPQSQIVFPAEPGSTVSWDHARIKLTADGTWLEDRGSTNGTFVDGEPIYGSAQLYTGDCIQLGLMGPELTVEQIDTSPFFAVARADLNQLATQVQAATPADPHRPSPTPQRRRPTRRWRSRLLLLVAAVALVVPLTVLGSMISGGGNESVPEGPAAPVDDPAPSPPVTDDAGDDLAQQAEAILRSHCYRCHGEGGSNEGGFNYVLERSRLVDAGYLEPNRADDSYVLQRVTAGEMPPAGEPQPSETELAVLQQWINAGAVDFRPRTDRPFIDDATMVRSISADLEKTKSRERPFLRYFTLTHLYNAGAADEELQTYRNALSKLVNSLSWKKSITVPRVVDESQTILAIDLRDYDWEAATWDAIVASNPYGVLYDTPEAAMCRSRTDTLLPYVRGDWFVSKASRSSLYEQILELPGTAGELEQGLGIDVEKNIRTDQAARGGVQRFGRIAAQPSDRAPRESVRGVLEELRLRWQRRSPEPLPASVGSGTIDAQRRRGRGVPARRGRDHLQPAQRSAGVFARRR